MLNKIVICLLLLPAYAFCMLKDHEKECIVPSNPILALSAYDEEVYFKDLRETEKFSEE